MTKIQIIGSCSGTEPIEGRHHTSVVITQNNTNYFFDAGENCSRLSHLGGIDLLNIRSVFISHTHYDHIGGLLGLFWNIRKLCTRKKCVPTWTQLPLYIPELETWEGVKMILAHTEGGFFEKPSYTILPQMPKVGLFYEDENLKVYGFPSTHLLPKEDGTNRAFSYRIDCPDYSVVYSGDVGSVEDLIPAIGSGCDLLMMETGHHKVKAVCDFAEAHNVKELVFYHHGREILNEMPTVEEAISACKIKASLSYDGMILERN